MKRVFCLLTLIAIGAMLNSAASAQTVACPSSFSLVANNPSELLCSYEQVLNPGNTEPQNVVQAEELLSAATLVCRGVTGGEITAGGRILNTAGDEAVFANCTIQKPSPPPPPPVNPPEPEIISFNGSSFFSANTGTSSVANSLVNICTSLQTTQNRSAAQQDLLDRCLDINSESNNDRQFNAVSEIAAKQVSTIIPAVTSLGAVSIGNIGSRLSALRGALKQSSKEVADVGGKSASSLMAKSTPQSIGRGGAAGDEEADSGFGTFVAVSSGDGDKEQTEVSGAFDYKSKSLTVGVDHQVDDSLFVGAAIGYGKTRSEFNNVSDTMEFESQTINIYAIKMLNQWSVDGILGIGSGDVINRRSISFTASENDVDQIASSETEVKQTFLSAGLTRSFSSAVDVDLTARLNYLDTRMDGFSERVQSGKKGQGLAIAIDDYDSKSITSEIGLNFSKNKSYQWGVLVPQLGISWVHEFEKGDKAMTGRFLADTSNLGFSGTNPNVFLVDVDEIDQNYGNFTLGFSALFPNDLTFSFSLSKTLGLSNFDHQYYSLTARKAF